MVTRRNLFAGVIAMIVSFLGVRAVRDVDEDVPIGTGGGAGSSFDRILRIRADRVTGFDEGRLYQALIREEGGVLERPEGAVLLREDTA